MNTSKIGLGLDFIKLHVSVIDAGLRATELYIYMVHCLFAHPVTGKATYSDDDELAVICGLNVKTVRNAQKRFKELGLATFRKGRGQKGKSEFELLAFSSKNRQHKQIDTDIITNSNLSYYDKSVYALLFRYENHFTGEASIGFRKIRDILKIGNTTLSDALNNLTELKLIGRWQVPYNGLKRNRYNFISQV